MLEFHSFVSKLNNLEKKRNFNVFQNYSLKDYINSIRALGLEEITKGQNRTSIRIGVIGTNGKGSVSHYLKECSLASGYCHKTGIYTSPHLLSPNDRIIINSQSVSDEWLNKRLNQFSQDHLEILRQFSFFEIYTLFAILYFDENQCDLEIYEAGLGGRKDATKIVESDYVVLTSIGLDHTEILGKTEEKILTEKLGIISHKTKILFSSVTQPNLRKAIELFCQSKKIQFIQFDSSSNNYLSFNFEFACHILERIFYPKHKRFSFGSLPKPRGRMEVLREDPILVFDIAHNPQAIGKALQSLELSYPSLEWTIFLACLKDKDTEHILQTIQEKNNIEQIITIESEEFSDNYPSEIKRISFENLTGVLKSFKKPALVTGTFRLGVITEQTLYFSQQSG